jgi:LCP family protein required for cell wall assembly
MTDRRRPSSIDGFMPSNQGRHIGFDSTGRLREPVSHVRTRAPALHSNPAAGNPLYNTQQRPDASASRTQQRASYSNLTSYGVSQSTGSSQRQPLQEVGKSGGRSRRSRRDRNAKQSGERKQNFFRRTNWKKVFKRTALITTIFVLVAGGWLGWKILNNSGKVFGGDGNILGLLNATKLKGEDKGRVNFLLAGVSTDDPGHGGANLTDSIMLVSMDTVNKKAFMLSIPRDLWVDIPSYGHSKINAANAYGDQDDYTQPGYPDGGMGLLEQILAENFQLPIHYYAKINYTAFKDAVNAVNGISVNIQSSDPRGLYDPNISVADKGPLKLANGVQTLDGQTALNLARARGDPPGDGRYPYGFDRSDFDRTEHQRMMLLALKDKVTSGSVITNPLKIGQLFDVVGKNMKTDLQPSEVRRIYDLSKQIKSADIQSLSLNDANGVNLLASYRTPDGASALIPSAGVDDFGDINAYIKKAMSSDPVVQEGAKIVVLNGGDLTGLATKYSNVLNNKGLNVVAVGDGTHQDGATVIIDQTSGAGKPGTKARLQQLFPGSTAKTQATADSSYPSADFIVVLGTNQKAPQDDSDE